MAKKEKAASTKAAVNKTPELAEAKKALETYLKENKLDPTKDWTKDKKHGKTVKALVAKLNKERDKAAAKYPESDPKSMKNLKKKAEKTAVTLEKKQKKDAYEAAEKKAAKNAKKEAKAPRTTKYDYPLIDGREMNSAEKKKYRMEQRKLANGGSSEKKEKKEKPAKAEKVEKPAKAKKEKKVEAPVEKTSKKKKIKKAAKKDED